MIHENQKHCPLVRTAACCMRDICTSEYDEKVRPVDPVCITRRSHRPTMYLSSWITSCTHPPTARTIAEVSHAACKTWVSTRFLDQIFDLLLFVLLLLYQVLAYQVPHFFLMSSSFAEIFVNMSSFSPGANLYVLQRRGTNKRYNNKRTRWQKFVLLTLWMISARGATGLYYFYGVVYMHITPAARAIAVSHADHADDK